MPKPHARVCITFDFDAMSGFIYGEPRPLPQPVSRGEFGGRIAAPRILELLDRYGITASWYVPGHTADTFPEVVREIDRRGHEIGHHGYMHEPPSRLKNRDEERALLEKGREALKRVTGKEVRGYRAPAWDLSEHTIGLLHELGFSYDSSLMWDDFRLSYARLGDRPERESAYVFGPEIDLVEAPIAWELDDWQWFEFEAGWSEGMFTPSRVEKFWRYEFDYMYEHEPGGVLTLTMHPLVIGRGARIAMLERVIRHIRSHSDVEFRTLEQVVAEFRAEHPFAAGAPRS